MIKAKLGDVNKIKETFFYVVEKLNIKPATDIQDVYSALYFIDFDYYEKYEEFFLGLTYKKSQGMPIPINLNLVISDKDYSIVSFYAPQTSFRKPIRAIQLHTRLSPAHLNEKEFEIINDVLNRFNKMSQEELQRYTQNDVPILITEEGEIIDYQAVFYRTPEYSRRQYEEH